MPPASCDGVIIFLFGIDRKENFNGLLGAAACCFTVGVILLTPEQIASNRETFPAFVNYPSPQEKEQPEVSFVAREYAQFDDFPLLESSSSSSRTLIQESIFLTDSDGRASIEFEPPQGAATFRVAVIAFGANPIRTAFMELVARLEDSPSRSTSHTDDSRHPSRENEPKKPDEP